MIRAEDRAASMQYFIAGTDTLIWGVREAEADGMGGMKGR